MATIPSSRFTHSTQKQTSTCPVPQLSQKEVERICKAFIKEQGVQDDASRSKKKMRHSPPQIDLFLQLKWGLTLLGEEKAKQYLEWLHAKLTQGEEQDSGV